MTAPRSATRLAAGALALLSLLPFVVFAWRFAAERTPAPPPRQPAWAHLVVLTAGRLDAAAAVEARAELESRAVRIARAFAPAASSAASAASLWTGRWPSNHGVVRNDLALPPGTWTLAAAARASGARTAAFLAEPFVDATGIDGFETAVADPAFDAPALAEHARDWLARTPGRFVLWLHLADGGDEGRALFELARDVQRELATDGRALDTATVVTAFASRAAPASEARFRVPLWFAMPARLWAGREGQGSVNLVDLAEPLRELLRLRAPEPGAPPLQSRAAVAPILRGALATPAHLLIAPERFAYFDRLGRLSAAGAPPVRLDGVSFDASPASARAQLARHYEAVVALVLEGGTAAVPAEVPPAFASATGW